MEVNRLEKLLLFVAVEEKVEDERKRVDDDLVELEKRPSELVLLVKIVGKRVVVELNPPGGMGNAGVLLEGADVSVSRDAD